MGISDKKTGIVWAEEPKSVCGLTLYPITMAHYSEWQVHKRALIVRQSTLPAAYVFVPYLSALYSMDCKHKTGLMYDTIMLLSLSTKLPITSFDLRVYADDTEKLAHIAVKLEESEICITPEMYPPIRKAIADLNGERLPDEGDNPELIEAEQDIATARSGVRLDLNANTMVASVAHQCSVRKSEIMDWTIREFDERRMCIERDKNHLICAIAEKMPLFKWAKGNPYPSWCFDALKEGSIALESFSAFSQRTGIGGSQLPIQSQNN